MTNIKYKIIIITYTKYKYKERRAKKGMDILFENNKTTLSELSSHYLKLPISLFINALRMHVTFRVVYCYHTWVDQRVDVHTSHDKDDTQVFYNTYAIALN